MECQICLEPYDLQARRPKNLPCGHSVCAGCLTRLPSQRCPICRKNFFVQVGFLPDSYALMEMIREAHDNSFRTGSELRVWCTNCKSEATAADCEDGHDVHSLKTALRLNVLQLQDQLSKTADQALAQLKDLTAACGSRQVLDALQVLDGRGALACDVTLRREGAGDDGVLNAKWQVAANGEDAVKDTMMKALAMVLVKEGALQKARPPPPPQPPQQAAQPAAQPANGLILHMDLMDLSQRDLNIDVLMRKAGTLDRIGRQGVRRLSNIWCHKDPVWTVQLLERAAPFLEELEVMRVGREHLQALHGMPRLWRLDLNGREDGLQEVLPALLPPPPHHAGLRWLSVSFLPRATLVSLLRAHGAALRHLQLLVGTPTPGPGDEQWPRSCDDLHLLLGQCGLRAVRRLVLLRAGCCAHSPQDCARQLADVALAMPGAATFCNWCGNIPEEAF